jgi:hypothetical protein
MALTGSAVGEYDGISPRWSVEKAAAWGEELPWLVGCNFTPSTAINQLEMWQEDTFDPETIDRELGWAADIGFNTVRVYIHDLVWENDAEGLKKRMNEYLEIADSHGIITMFVIFDDCWGNYPKAGKQPEPVKGTHNSGWVQSPGKEIVLDSSKWDRLGPYVEDILTSFSGDDRILLWDLYNEPGNQKLGGGSYPFVKQVIQWAQAANPSQPLSIGEWKAGGDFDKLNKLQHAGSDILTFHEYNTFERMQERITRLQATGRPVMCTEYMARSRGSRLETFLPVFKWTNVGAYNWGLVSGKTNTIYQWGMVLDQEPEEWFHDIFRPDGTAYRDWEVRMIKELTARELEE